MKRLITAVILLALMIGAASARELTSTEKKWVKACIDALGSGNAEVQSGAEICLARFGLDALPLILDNITKFRKDHAKKALVRAVAGMGRRQAVLRLQQTKLADARKYGKKADTLLEWLGVDDARGPAGPDAGKSPPEVAGKVRDILGDMRDTEKFDTGGKHVRQLVELGRDAVPELIAVIREGRSDGFGGFSAGFIPNAAAHALKELVVDDDLPLLAALLSEGHIVVACCFHKIRAEGTLNALLEPIKRGVVGFELMEALERFRTEKAVADVVLAYLKSYGKTTSADMVFEFVADAGIWDAVPVIEGLVSPSNSWHRKVELAGCLTRLGQTEGINQLLEILANQDKERWSGADSARNSAGRYLNWVMGRKVFVGSTDREGNATGNVAEALKTFRKWWEDVGWRIEYDKTARKWMVRPEGE